MLLQPDPAFMLWATIYVALKWSVGVWAFRRAKAYVAHRHEAAGNA
jgi:hypothetical protein